MSQYSAVYVVFGATGDLAQRKIIPSLLALINSDSTISNVSIVAYSRRPWNDDEYRAFIKPSLDSRKYTDEQIEQFLNKISYVQGTFDSADSYKALKSKLESYSKKSDVLFHFAVQPEFYKNIVEGLGKVGLTGKLLIEKPFGIDGASAESLQKTIEKYFSESNIFRIDHYLAKSGLREMIAEKSQNITAKPVRKIHAHVLEKLDIQGRGEFYDSVGVIRDVIQNHLLAMIASCIMLTSPTNDIQAARAAAISSLTVPQGEDFKYSFVRAQYNGYQSEDGVDPASDTETYAKISTSITAGFLRHVQVSLEAGKAMPTKESQITITFSDDSELVFDMEKKHPSHNDAYEILIKEAMNGVASYFVSMDEVRASWKFIDPIITHKRNVPLLTYKKGDMPHNI
ncbi:MAG: hypothetical protein V4519_03345 [Patescibacteria group bacterium]